MPSTQDPDFSRYFSPIFFSCFYFYFKRLRGGGRRGCGEAGRQPAVGARSPRSEPGAPSRSLTTPGAPSWRGGGPRAAPPSGPSGSREPGWLGDAGGSRCEMQGAACRVGLPRGVLPARWVLHSPRPQAGVRASLHTQVPFSGGSLHPSASPLHFAGSVVALPYLARVSLLPKRYPSAIFIH